MPAISVAPVVPKAIVVLPILIELFTSFAFSIVAFDISVFVIVPAAISAAVISLPAILFAVIVFAAIFVPVLLGFLWIYSHSLVFYIGAIFAFLSLIATQFIPSNLREKDINLAKNL